MIILPNDEFRKIIEVGYESRRTEFKPPFIWDKEESTLWLREKIIQTILALSNTRDGGDIIIGIVNDKELEGMNDEEVNSFNYDNLKQVIDGFASPGAEFDIVEGGHEQKRFLIIRVREFYDIPIICKRNGQHQGQILREGDIYCRARSGRPSTIRVTEKELREILELATDKSNQVLTKRGYVRKETVDIKELFRNQIQDLI